MRFAMLSVVLLLFSTAFAPSPPLRGPTFQVAAADLRRSPVFVMYGDMRFTAWRFAGNASSPWARRALVEKVASEKPDALFLTGDVPFQGAEMSDYDVFRQETSVWAERALRVYPALGNHEFYSHDFLSHQARGLANWWRVFPALNGLRWYSVQLGLRVYALCLDSNFGALKAGTAQRVWIDQQLSHLPDSIDYVFFILHHAEMGDHLETYGHRVGAAGHDLDTYLERLQPRFHAQFIEVSGHVHNYGRFERNGVVYLISGGGGAHPVFFRRQPDDQFKDKDLMNDGRPLPNYHYLKFELGADRTKVTMVRIANPLAAPDKPKWDTPDKFSISAGVQSRSREMSVPVR